MAYWKKAMMGPRPMGCWKGLNGRRRRGGSNRSVKLFSSAQIAAMELEALNGCAEVRKPSGGMTAKEIGSWGEDVALRCLLLSGYHLVARNWYCGHKELDLVMEDDRGIHVVEVRTRREWAMKDPLESVDHAKQRKILLAADAFVRTGTSVKDVFFDVVAIELSCGESNMLQIKSVNLIENAFLPIGMKTI